MYFAAILLPAALLAAQAVNVDAASEECTAAFSAATQSSACEASSLSLDQLRTDSCPSDCQALYDAVKTACEVGDEYKDFSLNGSYEESTLFEEEGYKWTSCDYSVGDFTPSSCQTAQKILYAFGDEGACDVDTLADDFSATIEVLKTDDCPTECQALYDFVGESCKEGDKYFQWIIEWSYSPEDVFNNQGHKWNSCDYAGYSPTDCQVAYSRLNYFGDEDPCGTLFLEPENLEADECPAPCQSLYNEVMTTCEEGEVVAEAIGLRQKYGVALLYHENKKWDSCDYGFTPTVCELALVELEQNTIDETLRDPLGEEEGLVSHCLSASNEGSCTDGCKALLDTIVQECKPPAQFSPSAGFGSQTDTVIDFEGPETMKQLGYQTEIESLWGGLSTPCWDYYTGETEGDFDSATSSTNGNGGAVAESNGDEVRDADAPTTDTGADMAVETNEDGTNTFVSVASFQPGAMSGTASVSLATGLFVSAVVTML